MLNHNDKLLVIYFQQFKVFYTTFFLLTFHFTGSNNQMDRKVNCFCPFCKPYFVYFATLIRESMVIFIECKLIVIDNISSVCNHFVEMRHMSMS